MELYSKEKFAAEMESAVREAFPNMRVEQRSVEKNKQTLRGLMVGNPNDNVSTIMYFDGWYDRYLGGTTFEQICEDFVACVETQVASHPQLREENLLADWQNKIVYSLVGLHGNEAYLQDRLYDVVMDMAKIYAIEVGTKDESMSANIPVTNALMRSLQTDQAAIRGYADKNTPLLRPAKLQDMVTVITNIMKEQGADPESLADMIPSNGPQMIIASNQQTSEGAAVMLYDGILDDVCGLLDTHDIFVLPSSKHEVICVAAQDTESVSNLYEMVRDINDTQLAPQDLLTTQVYHYQYQGQLEAVGSSAMGMYTVQN